MLKCVVGESLYNVGDVDGAINAWLSYLQRVPGKSVCSSRHSTAVVFASWELIYKLQF